MKKLVYLLVAVLLAVEISAFVPAQSYAATTGTVNTAALNVRTGASTSHTRIGLIYQGETVTILGSSGSWYQIQANIGGKMRTGYVHKDYINVNGSGGSTGSSGTGGTGVVNVSGLNLRSGPSTGTSIVGSISRGQQVTILATEGQWYKISVNHTTAYVFAEYITRTSSGGSSDSGNGGNTGSSGNNGSTDSGAGTGVVNVSGLNLRSGPSTSTSIVGSISRGQQVTILAAEGQWYKISVNHTTAYVFAEYITRTSSGGSSGSGDGNSGGGNGGNQVTGGSKGKVNTSALNVRTGASTSASRIGCIYLNDEVTILGVSGNWYKVSAVVGGRTVEGYVSSQYITPVNSGNGDNGGSGSGGSNGNNGSTVTGEKGVVNEGPLNVRSGPSTGHTILGYISVGDAVEILASEGDWYKVKASISGRTVTGYVFAKYITKNSGSSGNGSDNNGNNNNGNNNNNNGSEVKVGTVTEGPLNIRSQASTSASILGYLSVGAAVKIVGTQGDWYKIEVTMAGKVINGYVFAQYVSVSGDGNQGGDVEDPGASDTNFETQIAAFPESYKPYLRNLHNKYPNWIFKAVDTGLDWNSVIAGENVVAVNVVQTAINSSTNFAQLSTMEGAYDWATDKYTLCDAGNFYTASEDVLKYYMDPRNMLTEQRIFQFESQAYDSSQKRDVVQGILNHTFMSGNYTYTENGRSVTKNYTDTFMEAGKLAGVSPYTLAARSRQEVGINGSGSTSGNYGAYKGYYNYYNIGANAGSDPISNGLYYASGSGGKYTSYGRPWTNPYKAIVGGADFIGASYIRVGQNTNYFQKFNVVYHQALYKHQYMSAIFAPTSESSTVYNSYKNMGVLNEAFVFYIPVYYNMPAAACQMPAPAGNPNSYLKALSVQGNGRDWMLTPTFKYNTTTYDLVVDGSVRQVTINASSVSPYAKGISGTGTFNLNPGLNSFKVTCTAGNGTTTTYTLNISRAN